MSKSPLRRVVRFVALLVACAPLAARADASLFERMGGMSVVEAVAGGMIDTMLANPDANASFEGVNVVRLKARVASNMCATVGGGCKPSEDDMRTVHAGLGIRESDFYALVQALRDSLDANGVGEREKNELLRMVAHHKRAIVTR